MEGPVKRKLVRFSNLVAGVFYSELESGCRRPAGSDDWLLMLTVSGAGLLTHSAGTITVVERDVVLYKPGSEQDYRVDPSTGQWTFIWSHFHPRPAWLNWLKWPETIPGLMQLHLADDAAFQQSVQAMRSIIELSTSPCRKRDELAMNALETALIWCHSKVPQAADRTVDAETELAITYITQHLQEPMTLGDIATASHQSVTRLTHIFKRQLGLSPRRYVEQCRLDHATILLRRTSLSINEVSRQCGFSSQFYFSLRFKQYTGMTPRSFRNCPVIPSKTWGAERGGSIPVDPKDQGLDSW